MWVPTSKSLRVLVVDDCPDNRQMLGLLLQAWGYEVDLAHDGPSALATLLSFRPHVVLLDIALPGGPNGWDVARRLRQENTLPPFLLIALTGYGREQDKARSREAGFDAHLTKPADLAELHGFLERAQTVALVGAA